MKVSVAVALPARQVVVELSMPEGSTVRDAIGAARADAALEGVDIERMRPGIWSRPCAEATALREGDRVELYRPLEADPKEMRRARTRKRARG